MAEDVNARQRQRKRRAVMGACTSGAAQVFSALVLLWARGYATPGGLVSKLALLLAVLDLLSLIPTGIVLYQRLKEIEGGEEDAARKY